MSGHKLARVIGGLTLASALWFAAGLPPWWAPIGTGGAEDMRVTLLLLLHWAGLAVGGFGVIFREPSR